MTMDDEHLDGNGMAGLLAEITGAEMTRVLRTCQSCRARRPVGEHLAYRSAGVVLRCPNCTDVALVIGIQETRLLVEWRGIYEIER
jgi:predicted RNA-binding Zn-ribbon protein involved in translation (DUF1610 family)